MSTLPDAKPGTSPVTEISLCVPVPFSGAPEPLSWFLSLSIIRRLLKMWFLSHICRNDILFSLVAFWTFGKGYPVVWGSLTLAFVTQYYLPMIHWWISSYNKIDLSLNTKKKKASKPKQQKTKSPPKMLTYSPTVNGRSQNLGCVKSENRFHRIISTVTCQTWSHLLSVNSRKANTR